MHCAAIRRLAQLGSHRLDLVQRRVAKRLDFGEVLLQHGQRFSALTDTVGVLAAGELVLFVAVADHDGDGGVAERNQLEMVGATVEEKEMTADAARGGELVHDSAGHMGKSVLGGLAKQSTEVRSEGFAEDLL